MAEKRLSQAHEPPSRLPPPGPARQGSKTATEARRRRPGPSSWRMSPQKPRYPCLDPHIPPSPPLKLPFVVATQPTCSRSWPPPRPLRQTSCRQDSCNPFQPDKTVTLSTHSRDPIHIRRMSRQFAMTVPHTMTPPSQRLRCGVPGTVSVLCSSTEMGPPAATTHGT